MKNLIYAPLLGLLAACSNSPKNAENSIAVADSTKHELVLQWESDSTFKVPESVLLDKAAGVMYISNIDGQDPWKPDGKGSIGKMGLDGKIIAVDWVSGLESPKGMGMYGGKLYVADLTELVIIDIASGKIDKKVPIPGAVGLNDIAIDEKGILYVSDSAGKQVFRLENEIPEVFLKDLDGPNGLFINDGKIYMLDKQAMHLVTSDKKLTKICDGLEGNADGIEHVSGDEFLVSAWEGQIWYISAGGRKEKLLDTRSSAKNTADIAFDKTTRTLYVPTFFKNTIVAYKVK